jgi:hypothetical protein
MDLAAHPDLERLSSLITRLDAGSDEAIGLLLKDELRHSGYDEAPAEALCFAGTGGDGVHFSFLPTPSLKPADWPVVMTVPMQFVAPNLIVGANLREFLALGLRHGYFVLEQLAYEQEAMLEELSQPPRGGGQSALMIKGIRAIEEAFAIAPWLYPRERLATLQLAFPLP